MTETPHTPLEACPCCAHEAKFEKQMYAFPPKHWVKCTYCGMSSSAFSSRESALAAWNTRATPLPTTANNPETDAHRDLVEAARAVMDHFVYNTNGTGPGHIHKKPGVWDESCLPCEWCAQWNAFCAALTKAEVTHG